MPDVKTEYWAAAPIDEIADEVEDQFDSYKQWGRTTGYFGRIRASFETFYGFNDDGTLQIVRDKDQIARINVAHMKSLIRRLHILVTESKLAFQPRAKSSDSKSQIESDLTRGICEYYRDEKSMNGTLSQAVLGALVMLEYYVLSEWSFTEGYELTVDGGQTVRSGDQRFEAIDPLNVAKSVSTPDSPWYIVRRKVNKYDEAALHPQFADEILRSTVEFDVADLDANRLKQLNNAAIATDEDFTYKFLLLHARTPAMPQGRRVETIAGQVLSDGPLKYSKVPCFRISAGDVLSTAFGDSPSVDLLPLQEGLNHLLSAVVTNNLNNATQLIYSQDPNLRITDLGNGQKLVTATAAPAALNLTGSSGETYKLIDLLVNHQQLLSGVNDVARGQPSQEVKTSGGQALMIAQAIQYVSDLAQSYAKLAGDVASMLISNIQMFQTEEMTAYIVGQARAGEIKRFKAQDIMSVERVACDVGNPLVDTLAGRDQMVQQWMQMGILKDPKAIIDFYRTGQIDSATENQFSDNLRVRECNELIRKGQVPTALITDNHAELIVGAKGVMSSEEARSNPAVVEAFTAFVNAHIALMRQVPPDLAAVLAGQPLPPIQPTNPQPPAPSAPQIDGVRLPNVPPQTPPQVAQNYQQATQAIPSTNKGAA